MQTSVFCNLRKETMCFPHLRLTEWHSSPSTPRLNPPYGCVYHRHTSIVLGELTKRQSTSAQPNPKCAVHLVDSRRYLRSSSAKQLMVPRHRLSTVGSQSFSTAGPTIWNRLPSEVTSAASLPDFLRKLKTYLFRLSFPNIHQHILFLYTRWS